MKITVHDETTGTTATFTDDVTGAFAQAAYLLSLGHIVRMEKTLDARPQGGGIR